jgi:YD repeat-containing protein
LGSIPAITSQTTKYDCLGRPLNTSETVGTNGPFTFGYTYNLAGGLVAETYPSQRVVTTAYDQLNRPSGLTGQIGSTPSTYLKSVSYASSGAMSQLQFGAAPLATETVTFDQGLTTLRGQPTTLAVSLASGSNLLTLGYGYCPGTPAPAQCVSNNGNVQSANITTPGTGVKVLESFGYDKLNRLSSASEANNGGTGTTPWSQTYGYDAYGNRWVSANSGVPLSPFTPIVSTNFDSNNRLL